MLGPRSIGEAVMTDPEKGVTTKPLAIDLFCGLGGWTEGLLAEGFDVVGFDIEQHVYGEHRYPAQLVLQDILTLHGSQFRNADLIVASPPCQAYSYMAMPWTKAKDKAKAIRADKSGEALEDLNQLFDACFRIQREACEAAGRHIPMVVENVRGAIPWVGRSRWNYGSFHLWGDVPALMPAAVKSSQSAAVEHTGHKSQGMNWSDQTKRGQDLTRLAGKHCAEHAGQKTSGHPNIRDGHPHTKRLTNPAEHGVKQPGISGARANGKGDAWFQDGAARHGSKSSARKAASAMIAKIPLPLSRHIAATFAP